MIYTVSKVWYISHLKPSLTSEHLVRNILLIFPFFAIINIYDLSFSIEVNYFSDNFNTFVYNLGNNLSSIKCVEKFNFLMIVFSKKTNS